MFVPLFAEAGALLVTNRSADWAAAVAANRTPRSETHTPRALLDIDLILPGRRGCGLHQLRGGCIRFRRRAQPGRITYATASLSGTYWRPCDSATALYVIAPL